MDSILKIMAALVISSFIIGMFYGILLIYTDGNVTWKGIKESSKDLIHTIIHL